MLGVKLENCRDPISGAMTRDKEFQEVSHTGSKVTFKIVTDPDGRRKYQVRFSHSRPNAAGIFGVYALPQGIACAGIKMGGIGDPWNPPPHPSCVPVFIGSDSEGMFGHTCHACGKYWRSQGGVGMCPYCRATGDRHMFLTEAQNRYVAQYCEVLTDALSADEDGEHVIDMDVVADAIGNSEKPAFYYAEEKQQKTLTCDACGGHADILGKFCYCPQCGTRNDFHELSAQLAALRGKVNTAGEYEERVCDAVGAFDTFAGQLVEQLVKGIPLVAARKAKLAGRFHNLKNVAAASEAAIGFDILDGLSSDDINLAARMFHRRHVYEHLGGVVDQKYLGDSGDQTVRLGQAIHEDQNGANRLISIITGIGENFHNGFHELFPPEKEPIEWHARTRPKKSTERT